MSRILVVAALVLVLVPVALTAQDLELQPLLLLLAEPGSAVDAEASGLQLYRIPIAFTVRSLEERSWGLRMLLPVSLGVYDLRASTGIGDLAERVETMTVTPGLELLFRAGESWVIKPYADVGVTGSSWGDGAATLYSVGCRARGERPLGRVRLTTGAGARYSGNRSSRVHLADYTVIEVGADVQWPLPRRRSGREPRLGGYAIVRFFPDLEVPDTFDGDIGQVYEVGISFSTEPVLELWKVKLPWLGIGYRFGDLARGVRISFSFPF